MPDAAVVEEEADPYQEFEKALDAARSAAGKLFGKKEPAEEPEQPSNLKAAGELTRRIFAARRKTLAAKK